MLQFTRGYMGLSSLVEPSQSVVSGLSFALLAGWLVSNERTNLVTALNERMPS